METPQRSSSRWLVLLRSDYAGWVVGGISVAIIGGLGGQWTSAGGAASATIFTIDVLAYIGAIRAWDWSAKRGWTQGRIGMVRLAIVTGLVAVVAAALLVGLAVVRG